MHTDDPWIRVLRVVGPLLTVVFAAVLATGLLSGTLAEQGRQLLELQWGRITLIDTYLAFAVPVLWIWYREPPARAVFLTVGVVSLGSLVIWGYVSAAAWTASDRRELLHGSWEIRPRPGSLRWRRTRP